MENSALDLETLRRITAALSYRQGFRFEVFHAAGLGNILKVDGAVETPGCSSVYEDVEFYALIPATFKTAAEYVGWVRGRLIEFETEQARKHFTYTEPKPVPRTPAADDTYSMPVEFRAAKGLL